MAPDFDAERAEAVIERAIRNATRERDKRARQQLQEALEAGVWDQQMRPVRNVLSRIRYKMRSFGIDITSILETGYILMVTEKTKPGAR